MRLVFMCGPDHTDYCGCAGKINCPSQAEGNRRSRRLLDSFESLGFDGPV
jgi:hypothetical protein